MQDPTTRENFQLELPNHFQGLSLTDDYSKTTKNTQVLGNSSQRIEIAEKVVDKREH